MQKEELKQQIVEAVQDSTDIDDNAVSYAILDFLLDGILEQFIESNGIIKKRNDDEKANEKDSTTRRGN